MGAARTLRVQALNYHRERNARFESCGLVGRLECKVSDEAVLDNHKFPDVMVRMGVTMGEGEQNGKAEGECQVGLVRCIFYIDETLWSDSRSWNEKKN
jgi:hypothetical protein